jgi:hypothetical protein
MPKLAGTCGSGFRGNSLGSTLPTALRGFCASERDWYPVGEF